MVSTFDPKKTLVSKILWFIVLARKERTIVWTNVVSFENKEFSRNQCQLRIEEKPKFPLVWSCSHFLFNFVGPKILFRPSGSPKWIRSTCRGKPPGALEGLFSFGVSTLVTLDDNQHLPQLNFTDSALWTMTIWPLSVAEYDHQGFKVRKFKGGLETLFEFLLEGQGAPIHVLLHDEVTAKRHALFRSEHKMDPLTG